MFIHAYTASRTFVLNYKKGVETVVHKEANVTLERIVLANSPTSSMTSSENSIILEFFWPHFIIKSSPMFLDFNSIFSTI